MSAHYRIPEGQSVVFDLARIVATVAVFLGHATRPDMLSDVDVSLVGRATIPIFLMISGYMTAMTMSRGGKFMKKVLRRYLGLFFVVIPAILILFAIDLWLIHQGSPLIENFKFENEYSVLRFLREAFEALTFSGEYWRLDTVSQGLFGNQSFWTVEYIMAYVVITAAFYLLSGAMRVLTIVLCIAVAGPTVLLLSPLWLAGVIGFEIHRACYNAWIIEHSDTPRPSPAWIRFIRKWAMVYAAIGLIVVVAIELSGVGNEVYQSSKDWASYEYRQHLGMAKRFAWQWLLVPGLFLMMLGSKYLIHWKPSDRMVARCREVSRHTLPVYIFHFSLIYFVHSLIPNYQPTWASMDPLILVVAAAALTLLLSWLCYRYTKPVGDRLIARIL
ncbi:MAG: acyltransferase family protein [Pseudomonadota bacterium]